MPSMRRKSRRKLYVFVFAVMYAFVFFEAGILYQDKYSKMKQEAGQQNVEELKVLRRKELLNDFHHQPHILLQTASSEAHNDTSFTIKKTTSSLKHKLSNTDGSDFLVF